MSENNELEVGGGENVSLAKLTAEQQKALALLVEGKSIAEAARASGVSRPTVYKWMKQDVHFRAMMNQWRGELEECAQARLLTAVDKASDALEKGFEAGDARLALQFLSKMGMVAPLKIGETDAEENRRALELEDRKRKVWRRREMAKLEQAEKLLDGGML